MVSLNVINGTNDTGHYTAICNIKGNSDRWITYDDKDFKTNEFLNSRVRTPTAKVKFQRAAYMLFYQRRENVSLSSDSESNHDGSDYDDRRTNITAIMSITRMSPVHPVNLRGKTQMNKTTILGHLLLL